MNKLTKILLTSLITLVVFASCQKEVIQPNANEEDSPAFVMKNEDGSTTGDEERSDSNSDDELLDDKKPAGDNNSSSVGNSLNKIDNITDPNNDEDEKGKVGLNK